MQTTLRRLRPMWIYFSLPPPAIFRTRTRTKWPQLLRDFIHAFNTRTLPSYWGHGQKTAALIQVYDLILPLDLDRAQTLLSRLGAYANALLANRDDKTNFSREDAFRGQIMAAWGAITHNRDDKWNTDVVTSGLFVYAMAAFARRVLDRPDLYPQFIAQAIALINAVIETYEAFHPELRPLDDFAFYVLPRGYGDSDLQQRCERLQFVPRRRGQTTDRLQREPFDDAGAC